MTIQIKVPSVGESVKEVTVANWLKENGDWVEMDQVICEIESDKATVELTAESKGVLKILVEAGETVPVGQVIGELDPNKSAGAGAATSKSNKSESGKAERTDKTEKAEKSASGSALGPSGSNGSGSKTSYAENVPSPAAKKILDEKGINPQDVTASGKGGRITKADALGASGGMSTSTSTSASTPIPVSSGKSASEKSAPEKDAKVLTITSPIPEAAPGTRDTKKEKMSALRRTIAKRLVEVKNTTAMLTTFNEVDMKAVMDLRTKYKDLFKEKHQVGLGFMSFFTKAATLALQEFPAVNAMISGEEIIYHSYCDVGIAVSTPRGLVVPVVRNAESLGLAAIEKEILRLAGKARDNKLTMDEMTGGTFTITNGGVFGSMLSTPILNAPQSAILGMHNIVERPVAIKGEVHIRPIMFLALSYDHRIIDGRESVSFLKKIKEYIEDPSRLLLGV